MSLHPVELSEEQANALRELISSGEYASEDEALAAATDAGLAFLRARYEERRAVLQEYFAEADAARSTGRYRQGTAEALMAELRTRVEHR